MTQQNFPYAFFQGKIIPVEEAKVSIMTNALQYGTGLFGGIRGYLAEDGRGVNIFRLGDHYKRFLQSMRIIDRTIKYSHQELVSITMELIKKISRRRIVIFGRLLTRETSGFRRIYQFVILILPFI